MAVKLNNPLVTHFYTQWNKIEKENFHQNQWARLVLEQKWKKVAHLWSIIKQSVDDHFSITAKRSLSLCTLEIKPRADFLE